MLSHLVYPRQSLLTHESNLDKILVKLKVNKQ